MICRICKKNIRRNETRHYSIFRLPDHPDLGRRYVRPHWCMTCNEARRAEVDAMLDAHEARESKLVA